MTAAEGPGPGRLYPYRRHPDQDRSDPVRHPVVVVGAGPVGLTLALDLGLRGVPVLLLDEAEGTGAGSRAICFAKRTLEILDRLGVGEPIVRRGVTWSRGRVYRGTEEIYAFDLLPEDGHRRPAFVNIEQPWVEAALVQGIREAQAAGAPIDLRGGARVVAVTPGQDGVALTVETPEGPYPVTAEWLVACDGARSPVRGHLGLEFAGRTFEDNFLIADIWMQADFPAERRFWFDPPFNPGQTALLHKQPGDLWRLDFQLGPGIDRAAELDPDRVAVRVRGMIGDAEFTLDWTSIYTFRCASMERYRHGRVLFAGDAAHQVSPFGARGANGGIQDADNLGWKLAAVLAGAPDALLDSYDAERRAAADENIRASTRTADFLTPRSPVHALFRTAVLDLALRDTAFRPWVNSGRLSVPCCHDESALNGPDADGLPARTRPGAAMADAPVEEGWLLDRMGEGFTVLALNSTPPETGLAGLSLAAAPGSALAQRYLGGAPQAVYLIRPDRHVAARWTAVEGDALRRAHRRATGGE